MTVRFMVHGRETNDHNRTRLWSSEFDYSPTTATEATFKASDGDRQ